MKIALENIDEKFNCTTKLMVDIPMNVPIVWKEIKTPLGKRIGFVLYKKWYEFWK